MKKFIINDKSKQVMIENDVPEKLHNIVIGFSFMGDGIPAGSGLLTSLKYDVNSSEYCLSELIITSSNATTINAEVLNCNTIFYGN